MNKLEALLKLVNLTEGSSDESSSGETFLEVNKIYAFRTITMIYTGRLKAINKNELLIDEAAWIPETARWAQFVDTGEHNEAEPYKRPVILNRSALLDTTELLSVIRTQK